MDLYKHHAIDHVKPHDIDVTKARNYLKQERKIMAVKAIANSRNNCAVKGGARIWGLLDSKLYVERVLEKESKVEL